MKFIKPLIAILVNLTLINYTLAKSLINEPENSPDYFFIDQLAADIEIKEISLKNSTADFFTFSVKTPQKKINLRGLEFYDDKIFKKIDQDFWVKNDDLIKLNFNSTKTDSVEDLNLFTEQKGLTATSDQLIIKTGENYYDFFCWQKDPISKTEKSEWEKIYHDQFWEEAEIESCFNSEKISANQSIIRISKEKNSSSWQIKDEENSLPSKQSSTTSEIKKTSTKAITPIIDNESTPPENPELRISEIFAAPINNQEEWIELENLTKAPINLNGWIIDDQEGGSKPQFLNSQILPSEGFLTIPLKNLKINLNNSGDQIRIFQPNGQIIASQEYEEAVKNQSFSLIKINNEESWQNTEYPTPGQANLKLTSINAKITSKAEFKDLYNFTITTLDKDPVEKILVIFDEKTIKGPLAQLTFINNAQGNFTGEISPAPNNKNGYDKILKLHKFQIQNTPAPNNSPLLTLIPGVILIILGIYFLIKKYIPKTPNH